MSKFATFTSKLYKLVANCSEQTANQNTNIAAEVCKIARERTSGLTVSASKLLELHLIEDIEKKKQGDKNCLLT